MNPRLRALLVVVAVGLGAGGVAVWTWDPEQVARVDLVDGGIREDCVLRDIQCGLRFDPPLANADGGRALRYAERVFPVAVCAELDGGTALIIPPRVLEHVPNLRACRRVGGGCTTCDGGDRGALEPRHGLPADGQCACRRTDAGPCRSRLPDGGLRLATIGAELQPGEWVGPGCWPKPCGEFHGEQGMSWPEECPQ